jgi:hypothetical protein
MYINGLTLAEVKELNELKFKLYNSKSFLLLTEDVYNSKEYKRYLELYNKKSEYIHSNCND